MSINFRKFLILPPALLLMVAVTFINQNKPPYQTRNYTAFIF